MSFAASMKRRNPEPELLDEIPETPHPVELPGSAARSGSPNLDQEPIESIEREDGVGSPELGDHWSDSSETEPTYPPSPPSGSEDEAEEYPEALSLTPDVVAMCVRIRSGLIELLHWINWYIQFDDECDEKHGGESFSLDSITRKTGSRNASMQALSKVDDHLIGNLEAWSMWFRDFASNADIALHNLHYHCKVLLGNVSHRNNDPMYCGDRFAVKCPTLDSTILEEKQRIEDGNEQSFSGLEFAPPCKLLCKCRRIRESYLQFSLFGLKTDSIWTLPRDMRTHEKKRVLREFLLEISEIIDDSSKPRWEQVIVEEEAEIMALLSESILST